MNMHDDLLALLRRLQDETIQRWKRRIPVGELLTDRWEIARQYGFGEGTSCYDSVIVYGDVKVGKNTWIGPNVILDGAGGLSIGDNCSISAGVQIYSHHTVRWANSLGEAPYEYKPTQIGSGVYIGPTAVIQMGVTIGDSVTIGALSLVNRNLPAGAKAYGIPARIISPQRRRVKKAGRPKPRRKARR
jgi:acetyltransferase-like isoleucine patch superfamily enzyme